MSRVDRARLRLAKCALVVGLALMFAVDILYCAIFRIREGH